MAFGYVEEDILDLQDVGDVLFDLVAPFEDFVLVACNFEALLACEVLVYRGIDIGGVCAPFFMRTSETLVSLIWFDGWKTPTGISADYGGRYGYNVDKSAGVCRKL